MAFRIHPKWNVILALGVAAAAIGAAVVYAHPEIVPFVESKPEVNSLLQGADNTHPAQTDTDGDGLKDWEERLWETDPDNPDSDGDGTEDGAEVAAGRDPAVAGPNDSLAAAQTNTATSTPSGTAATTTTGILAREFFTEYLETRQDSGQLNPEQSEQLATQFVERAVSQNSVDRAHFAESDIAQFVEATDENRSAYYASFQTIIEPLFTIQEYELTLARDALQGDTRAREALEEAERIYRSVAGDLTGMRVPTDIRTTHLALANSLYAFADVLAGVAAGAEDPARALGHIHLFTDIETDMQEAFADIGTYAGIHELSENATQ